MTNKSACLRSSLAAVIVACVAIGLAACGTAAAAPPQADAPHTGSVSPTATISAPASPTSAATPSKAAPAPHGTVTATVTVTPHAQNAAATLKVTVAPSRLDAFTAESWTALGAGPVRDVTGHDIELNECASVPGAATWQQQPYTSSGGNSAILETYTFADQSAAGSAYAAVLAGMRSCQATSRAVQSAAHIAADAVCRETADATGAAAFERTWTGVQGVSAAGPQINHIYLAVRGATVVILHFDEPTSSTSSTSPYDVRNDPSVLSMLTDALASQAGTG